MIELYVFRITVHPVGQTYLLAEARTAPEVLAQCIKQLPSAERRKGSVWHLGDVEAIEGDGLYFRIGKTTKATLQVYEDGHFLDQQIDTAPYTHVILDVGMQVCAIAKNTNLSPNVDGIARRLVHVLGESELAREIGASFEIKPIIDPEDFIAHIRSAYKISSFWVSYSQSNPFDVNRDFIKPWQSFVAEANARRGKTEITGEDLNPEVIEEISRSAASTGDDASARLQQTAQTSPVRKRLKGNAICVSVAELLEEKLPGLLHDLRAAYARIRRGHGAKGGN